MSGTTGLTRDAGWEAGVRRTFPVALDEAWAFLLGDGLALWLGAAGLGREVGSAYRTSDGSTGTVRSFHDRRRIRLTWRPADWDHDTTLQLTVLPAAAGTTIAFHQDRLAGPAERAAMLERWRQALDRIGVAIEEKAPGAARGGGGWVRAEDGAGSPRAAAG